MPHDADARLAADLAAAAAELLLEIRASGLAVDKLGDEGDQPGQRADPGRARAGRPGRRRPLRGVRRRPRRLDADRVWIVDPLDGTREFGEIDRDDWAVHVALAIDGVAAVGAVALPGTGPRARTAPAGRAPAAPTDGRPRLVVSRTRPPAVTEHARRPRSAPSSCRWARPGAKAMAIVLGDADVYAHAGGQYQWDSAAPVAVAGPPGSTRSRLDGSPLVYNDSRPLPPRPPHLPARAAPTVRGRLDGAVRRRRHRRMPDSAPYRRQP